MSDITTPSRDEPEQYDPFPSWLLSRLFSWPLVGVLLLASFTQAMSGFDHNENMYLAAAVNLQQGKVLYADFSYVQTPYLPHIYCLAFTALGSDEYLLTAKLITWSCLVIAGVLVYCIGCLLSDRRVAFTITTLFFLSPPTLLVVHESSNYVLPMMTSLAAAWLVLTAARESDLESVGRDQRGHQAVLCFRDHTAGDRVKSP
jgi:hypothetical protein